MKIRNGFVSNSSSSSFLLKKSDLTLCQIIAIQNHIEFSKYAGINYARESDRWDVIGALDPECDTISLYTSMDNFDMRKFLHEIGVNDDMISERY